MPATYPLRAISAFTLSLALFGHASSVLAVGPQVTALITKQIEAVEENAPSQSELTTVVASSQRLALAGLKMPTGVALASSSQSDANCVAGQGECKQRFTLNLDTRKNNCSLSGAYIATFQANCLAGAGAECQAGSVEVPFQLASSGSCTGYALTSAPVEQRWQQLPGAASDLGMGGGTLWAVGDKAVQGGQAVLRWDGQVWVDMRGGAVRLDVDPQGYAWVVNDKGEIWRHNGTSWGRVVGAARDIGIGADGSVWVVGTQAAQGGFQLFKWNNGNWQLVPGGAVRIDVDAHGNAWGIGNDGIVRRYTGTAWQPVPGVQARDIGIGGDGSVFVAAEDRSVLRWNGQAWLKRDGKLAELTVDAQGVPFGSSDNQQIWMGYR